MTRVYIGIGSNIERERNVRAALDRFIQVFKRMTVSPVYESDAVGFAGAPFLNLVIGVDTDLSLRELMVLLRGIEFENGNSGNLPKFSARSLDLDLLTYGDFCGVEYSVKLPRADIVEYAYALWPLADIAGAELHPQLGISYGALKQQFAKTQKLWPVPFYWNDSDLSSLKYAS